MRLEAREDYLKLDGEMVSAKIPATVYEPGVLFLRITRFRRMLRTIKGQKMISIQVNKSGMLLDNVTMDLEHDDMLLYVDPDHAPMHHPDELWWEQLGKEPPEDEPELVEEEPLPEILPLWEMMWVDPGSPDAAFEEE